MCDDLLNYRPVQSKRGHLLRRGCTTRSPQTPREGSYERLAHSHLSSAITPAETDSFFLASRVSTEGESDIISLFYNLVKISTDYFMGK